MSATRRSAVTALLAATAVTGTILATAAPAQAAPATQCSTTSKTFNLPQKPDVKVTATICLKRAGVSGGYRYYRAWLSKVSWDGTSFYTGGRRFNSIDFLSRAEHGRTAVDNCSPSVCEMNSLADAINNAENGTKTFRGDAGGYGVAFVKTKATNWTADATAWFDIADDGKPEKKWELTGTRTVH
ncbi:hypothetical protein AB0M39_21650 [Streptomyces sp. NPDC051907]|uniref:hypothetical protein n=1 Tax=Streptomyces sp. NPDC051907 TaxID=3155284 RepID=UPI0034216711